VLSSTSSLPHLLLISHLHSLSYKRPSRESVLTTYYRSLHSFPFLLYFPSFTFSSSTASFPQTLTIPLQTFNMDFSSAKRGTQPAPAQSRRHRNPPQTQSRNAPIPPRQRHTDPTYYHPEDTSSQNNHDTYGYNADQYPDQSSQWERQPSAHLSEIESVEESQLGSQQQGDMGYEGYESDNRLIPAPRSHGDRQNYEGVEQYDEVSCRYQSL